MWHARHAGSAQGRYRMDGKEYKVNHNSTSTTYCFAGGWHSAHTVAQPLAPWPTPLPAMKLLHTENTQGQLAPKSKNITRNQPLPSVTTHIYVIDKSLEGAAVN